MNNKILVVDDEQTVCDSVEKVLSRQGLSVDKAGSVEEGWQKIEERDDYAAVLVDLVMPRAGGDQLLQMLQQRGRGPSVVVMTGYASIESAVRTTKLGAFEYITKPFTPEELREVADRAIRSSRSLFPAPAEKKEETVEDAIDVDMPFSEKEVSAQTSRNYADHLTRSDIAPSHHTFPENFCVKGDMVCKRFQKQNGPCEGECPIQARKKRKAATGLAGTLEDAIDVDMPFSAREVERYTCPEYVQALGPSDIAVAARWPAADEDLLRKVLVIDDESVVCNSVRKILSRNGYQVEETDDGREALNRLRGSDYDLVILDMVMPKMNGLDVLKEIKTRRPDTRVVMITGYASIETAKDAIRLGATDYLPKPFTPAELIRTASEAVAA
jgi:DNA-binding NtrC family response regulator